MNLMGQALASDDFTEGRRQPAWIEGKDDADALKAASLIWLNGAGRFRSIHRQGDPFA